MLRAKDFERGLASDLGECFSDNAKLVLESCSTGKDYKPWYYPILHPGIGQRISNTLKHVFVIAPAEDTTLRQMTVSDIPNSTERSQALSPFKALRSSTVHCGGVSFEGLAMLFLELLQC